MRILNAALSVLLLIALQPPRSARRPQKKRRPAVPPSVQRQRADRDGIPVSRYFSVERGSALQGGFDYTYEPWGFYMGFWASSIEFNARTANTSSIETNFYGGFAGEFPIGVSWNIGGLYYYYPDTDEDLGADLQFRRALRQPRLYLRGGARPHRRRGFAWSPDFYGEDDDGLYLHGKLSVSLPYNFGLSTMFGYQDVDGDLTSGPAGFDYSHWNVGLSYDYSILSFEVSWNDGSDDCGPSDICEAWLFTVSSSW